MGEDPLGLDPETMRRLGYQTVDLLVDRLAEPATSRRCAARRPRRWPAGWRATARGPAALRGLLEQLATDVLPFISRSDHPGSSPSSPAAGPGPARSATSSPAPPTSTPAPGWRPPGPSQLELTVLDWFKEWIGYPEEAAGVLVCGGSAANMTALACAREALLGAMSRPTWSPTCPTRPTPRWRARPGCSASGPTRCACCRSDERFRMRPRRCAAAIDADSAPVGGRCSWPRPPGATNTGAVDPLRGAGRALPRARRVAARRRGLRRVRDADRARPAVRWPGIELADSVTLDPHKWLYQPFECGCLLVRDGPAAARGVRDQPVYLKDTAAAERRGELRRSRLAAHADVARAQAVAVAAVLRRRRVPPRRSTARSTSPGSRRRRIEESAELELLTPASLGVVCFRRRLDGTRRGRAWSGSTASLCRGSPRAARAWSPRPACAGASRCGSACSTTPAAPGRRAGARLVRARAPTCPPRPSRRRCRRATTVTRRSRPAGRTVDWGRARRP